MPCNLYGHLNTINDGSRAFHTDKNYNSFIAEIMANWISFGKAIKT